MQPIPVLFENTDLIIVNKPIGIAMHDATNEADVRENIENTKANQYFVKKKQYNKKP